MKLHEFLSRLDHLRSSGRLEDNYDVTVRVTKHSDDPDDIWAEIEKVTNVRLADKELIIS